MKYLGRKSGMTRSNAIIMISNMYINKNMTVKEISEKTGYTENTIKRYLYLGGVRKNELKDDHGYIKLDNNSVLYNGKIYKKMSKDELINSLKENICKKE